ncbi:MAG: heavy metal-binding domain-containing protein [Sandaracinaceae bacterium]|nr:heavy metal-binding domain-containing protein [Sandaracinaceae bacterium]
MSIFHDFLTTLTDMAGGRSQTMQNALRRARVTCLAELRNEAHALAADAVIGVDLDYSEVSSQGKNMLFLVASGTAVRVRDVPPLPPV